MNDLAVCLVKMALENEMGVLKVVPLVLLRLASSLEVLVLLYL